MNRILAVTGLALMLAAPVFAAPAFAQQSGPMTAAEFNSAQARAHGDQEVADNLEWKELVARANADRLHREQNTAPSYAASGQATTTVQ